MHGWGHGNGNHGPHGQHGGWGPQQQQGQWGQQQQQGQWGPAYAQQGNYQQQQGTGQWGEAPSTCHEHPLDHVQNIPSQCKVCHQAGKSGYKCAQCPIILCDNCTQTIYYGNKARQVHNCPLKLVSRNAWKCDVCKTAYKDTASFNCKKCDFDACKKCYVGN